MQRTKTFVWELKVTIRIGKSKAPPLCAVIRMLLPSPSPLKLSSHIQNCCRPSLKRNTTVQSRRAVNCSPESLTETNRRRQGVYTSATKIFSFDIWIIGHILLTESTKLEKWGKQTHFTLILDKISSPSPFSLFLKSFPFFTKNPFTWGKVAADTSSSLRGR